MADTIWDKLKAFDWGSTDTARMLGGLASAFTAPRDAINGQLDPWSDAGRQRALGTAMLMLGRSPAAGTGRGVAGAYYGDPAIGEMPPSELLPLFNQPAGAAMPQMPPRPAMMPRMSAPANDRVRLRVVSPAWNLDGQI